MTTTMFDLTGADDRRFSPYCWRTRMAFAHKGVDLDTKPVGFTDIASIDTGNRRTVPTLQVDDKLISDSWEIAVWLEENYPDKPSLFGTDGSSTSSTACHLTEFVQGFTASVLHMTVATSVLLDIHDHLQDKDKGYFRMSREKAFGKSLEEVQSGREDRLKTIAKAMTPIRLVVRKHAFLGGDVPTYADYIVFGAFQWARTISDFRLLPADDPVMQWRDRVAALHGGLANSLLHYADA